MNMLGQPKEGRQIGGLTPQAKNQKGLVSEPLPAKPHFTPSRTKPGRINHPGKNQNHLTTISANQVPQLKYLLTIY